MPVIAVKQLESVGLIRRVTTNLTLNFKVNQDSMTNMHYIWVYHGQKAIGHLDFLVKHNWMEVMYGTFSTSAEGSYNEWIYSCLKDAAISIDPDYRLKYRGLGSALVSVALSWGRQKGLLGMRVIEPRTPNFWKSLKFTPEGNDLVFYLATMRTPQIRIKIR